MADGSSLLPVTRGSPWPSPSPIDADRMAAAVLDPPFREDLDFYFHVTSRYAATLAAGWIESAWWAARTAYPRLVSDERFGELFAKSSMSKMYCRTLDPVDVRNFEPFLGDAKPGELQGKLDFTTYADMPLMPGLHAAPSVTLMRIRPDGTWYARAIRINGLLLTPADTNAWNLAKLFVLQGASQHMVACHHIQLHFPPDALNALTKSMLPAGHPVRALLTPHFRFSLPLSNAALMSRFSVLTNHQLYAYSPFVHRKAEIYRLVVRGHDGIDGNSAYPRFRFPSEFPEIAGEYGRFLRLYFDVIQGFTRAVAETVPAGDPLVAAWADEGAKWVRGFPDGRRIHEPGVLAWTLAYLVWNVTVAHAADHHAYGNLVPIEEVPMRLRVPPPSSRDMPPVDEKKLATKVDAFRHRMGWKMFFREETVVPLATVRHPFVEPALREASAAFARALVDLDAILPVFRFAPLSHISSSIQY